MRLSKWSALVCIMSSCLFVSCSTPARVKTSYGPDATISQLPDATDSDQWPSEALQMVVARPSYEPGSTTRNSIDPRTTLAVLDPDRATWIMASRMHDEQGILLTRHLEEMIVLKSGGDSASGSDRRLEALIFMRPQDGQSTRILPDGQWQVVDNRSETGVDASSTVVMVIQDSEGQVAAKAEMDIPTARDLLLRLSSAIRAPG